MLKLIPIFSALIRALVEFREARQRHNQVMARFDFNFAPRVNPAAVPAAVNPVVIPVVTPQSSSITSSYSSSTASPPDSPPGI